VAKDTIVERVDEKISELEGQLEKLRTIREAMLDPNMAHLLDGLVGPNGTESTVDKIRRFFQQRHNHPATIPAIMKATKSTRPSVTQVFHETNKNEFEQTGEKEGKAYLWHRKLDSDTQ
jgi:hypothetical protein